MQVANSATSLASSTGSDTLTTTFAIFPSATSPSFFASIPTADIESESNINDAFLKFGLGAGVGLGIPLVLVAGIWIGLRAVKQRKSSSPNVESSLPLTQLFEREGHTELESQTAGPVCQTYEIYEATVERQIPAELGG